MFRFTIRDMLWVTVVVALGVGWWVDRSRLSNQLEKYKEKYGPMITIEEFLARERPD